MDINESIIYDLSIFFSLLASLMKLKYTCMCNHKAFQLQMYNFIVICLFLHPDI